MLDGWIADNKGQITAPVAKDKNLFPRVKICHARGKVATSEYIVFITVRVASRQLGAIHSSYRACVSVPRSQSGNRPLKPWL